MATAARRFSRKPESASCLLSVFRERWFANSSEWLSPTDSIRRSSEAGSIAVRIGTLPGCRCRARTRVSHQPCAPSGRSRMGAFGLGAAGRGRVLAVNLALHPDEAGWGRVAGWWRRLRGGERPVLYLQFDPERCAPTHGTTIFFGTEPENATDYWQADFSATHFASSIGEPTAKRRGSEIAKRASSRSECLWWKAASASSLISRFRVFALFRFRDCPTTMLTSRKHSRVLHCPQFTGIRRFITNFLTILARVATVAVARARRYNAGQGHLLSGPEPWPT